MQPKYRDDIKGMVSETKHDFYIMLSSELQSTEDFYFGTDDEIRETDAYAEYALYLTDVEMLAVARKIK